MPRTKKLASRANINQSLSLVRHDILSDKQLSAQIAPILNNNNMFDLFTRNLSFSSDFKNDSLNNNDDMPDDNDTYKVPANNSAIVTLAENYNEISVNADGQLSTLQGTVPVYYLNINIYIIFL